MTLDSVTGLYYSLNRNYDASLGRWINQDPLQYINGANTYQFVMSNPVGNVDPSGLAEDDDGAGADPSVPPPDNLWQGIYELFGFQPYFGPPIVDTPPGYAWWYPPTISPQGAPPDESLWQLQPTDLNNPGTPSINPIGPNGQTLTPEDQVDVAMQAMRDAADKKEPQPDTKGPARKAYPDEGHHFLPKQFADNFKKVGLNPDDFVDPLPRDVHRLKPNGLHTGPYQDSWNGQ
jgi:RHS repeat-associated protein